jgi:hypothetical protein
VWPLRTGRLATVFLAIFVTAIGCGRHGPPAGVPEGATRVSFSQNGGWAYCWLDTTTQFNRCRTYNAGGERLYRIGKKNDDDDVFLRYEGSGPVAENELQIDIVHTQPDFIWLKNGVVLLPRNDYEHQKSVVDELNRIGSKAAEK